jgi:hypothetical protein
MLILGILAIPASIALLVLVISHSPNIGFGEAVMAGPGAQVIIQPYYSYLLIGGWIGLFIGLLLTVSGIVLMALAANRARTTAHWPPVMPLR